MDFWRGSIYRNSNTWLLGFVNSGYKTNEAAPQSALHTGFEFVFDALNMNLVSFLELD